MGFIFAFMTFLDSYNNILTFCTVMLLPLCNQFWDIKLCQMALILKFYLHLYGLPTTFISVTFWICMAKIKVLGQSALSWE